tara:strand:+ start:239 stop:679 length:441 start_codon:yes stop_codon:yes gene_type:complete
MKTLFTILLSLCFVVSAMSQDTDKTKEREKIEALKVAHITSELDLSQTEAQKFWPAYNAFENKKQALRKEKIKLRSQLTMESLNEADAKNLVDKMLNFEKEETNLKTNYISSLQSIISNKKIIKLFEAERSFKLKMIKEFKGRHRK